MEGSAGGEPIDVAVAAAVAAPAHGILKSPHQVPHTLPFLPQPHVGRTSKTRGSQAKNKDCEKG